MDSFQFRVAGMAQVLGTTARPGNPATALGWAILSPLALLASLGAIRISGAKLSSAPTIATLTNGAYAAFSLGLLVMALADTANSLDEITSWSHVYCTPPDLSKHAQLADGLFLIYYFSKFWENIDVLVVALIPGADVGLQFVFHHATTPLFAWAALQTLSPSLRWGLLANKVNHTIMYSYFAFPPLRNRATHWILVGCQLVQLSTIMMTAGAALVTRESQGCGGENWADVMALGLAAAYLMLFVRDTWCVGRPAKATKAD